MRQDEGESQVQSWTLGEEACYLPYYKAPASRITKLDENENDTSLQLKCSTYSDERKQVLRRNVYA